MHIIIIRRKFYLNLFLFKRKKNDQQNKMKFSLNFIFEETSDI